MLREKLKTLLHDSDKQTRVKSGSQDLDAMLVKGVVTHEQLFLSAMSLESLICMPVRLQAQATLPKSFVDLPLNGV